MEINPEHPINNYKLTQFFGSNESNETVEEDIISCLRYDPTGKYLCLGDNAGRAIIFQNESKEPNK